MIIFLFLAAIKSNKKELFCEAAIHRLSEIANNINDFMNRFEMNERNEMKR